MYVIGFLQNTYAGNEMMVVTEASYFMGNNAFGVPLIGGITGSYDDADLGDLTPAGICKENGCVNATDPTSPGRPNNVPICPMIAPNGIVYNTFGGGGLIVVDSTMTPMKIVGAYGNTVVYGAGVCGEAVGDKVYFHITNHEQDFDVPHGFSMIGQNTSEILIMPGQTKTNVWEPKKPGVWPFYCTDFCSALHQEMQGYARVSPAGANVNLEWKTGD